MIKVKTTFSAMATTIKDDNLLTNGNSNLLFTGAKGKYLGGGWWNISGYAWNNEDVTKVLTRLSEYK